MSYSNTTLKVSIITVTYNSDQTLLDTIDSVFNQNYKNIEYIVIDGNSTDLTKKIIYDNLHKIDIFLSENDSGIYNAMNKGLKLATGDIIGYLNSDDVLYDSNVISKIVSIFSDGIYGVYGNIQIVKKDNINSIIRVWKSGRYPGSFRTGWMPPHPSLYINASILRYLNGFNENYKIQSDYDLMLRFFDKHKFTSVYLNETFVKMRYGGKSTSSLKNILKGNIEAYKASKIEFGYFSILTVFFKIMRKIPQYLIVDSND